MIIKLVKKVLKDQRNSLIFWSLGNVFVATYVTQLFPTVQKSAASLKQYIESMPESFRSSFLGNADFTTPEGYLTAEMFSFMIPLLFLIFAVTFASSAIAAEEEKGTLEVLLSNPVNRSKAVIGKFLVLFIDLIFLAAVLLVATGVGISLVNMDIDFYFIVDMVISLVLLTLYFGSLALSLGCMFGSRAISASLTGVVGVGTYLINAFAPSVESLQKFQKFSPFYDYIGINPLINGLNIKNAFDLVLFSAIFLIAGLIVFQRRDLKI